jgi:Na+-transporting methylmalonyl-CoA/oxaloacetate decarboxylase gamma subunit
MSAPDLWTVCGAAFAVVFFTLAVLAVIMRLITALFPAKAVIETDSAMVAAVVATMQSVYPGAQVTRVEEQK